MAVTTIPWGDGSGENIYLSCDASEGDQIVLVSSDINDTYVERKKTITFSIPGGVTQLLDVTQSGKEGGRTIDYVQDGLVLHMDGIEKGSTSDAWTSLVGNYVFINKGATFNSNHVLFDGSNWLENTSFSPPTSADGTIEAVFSVDNINTGGIVFSPKTVSGAIALGWTGSASSHRYIWSRSSRPRYNFDTGNIGSVSISGAMALRNGSTLSQSGSDYFSGGNSINYIGRRNSSGYHLKGKIYSIRIYSRQLTREEVLANLAVDNLRFELGLTL